MCVDIFGDPCKEMKLMKYMKIFKIMNFLQDKIEISIKITNSFHLQQRRPLELPLILSWKYFHLFQLVNERHFLSLKNHL